MQDLDPTLLARIQFAFTVAFHIIFPAFSIGMASFLAVLEGLWLRTGRAVYLQLFRYWVRIFALVFGMGVVSGVVMSFQFGTNWSVFADKTGPVLGPLMGYEVMSAFFLEAGFLGIMLFGMNRVGPRLHFFATLMVAFGTALSAFWILSVNSWMHTPAGYAINEAGQFVPRDWMEVIFNPSFPYRLTHMVLAAYLTTAFAVAAVGAWHLLRDRRNEAARKMFSLAMGMAVVLAPLQMVAGDAQGRNTLAHQPLKIAAIEGHFETMNAAPLVLIGWPNVDAGRTEYKIEVPYLSSLILTHSLDGQVPGLNSFPRENWPPAATIFWTFRLMVGLAVLMTVVAITGLVLRKRGRLYEARWFHWVAVATGPAGFCAILAGWVTTEVGRQPFTVYNLLRTADSVSPVPVHSVMSSLAAFVVVYLLVFGTGIYYTLRMMAATPGADQPLPNMPQRTAGPAPGAVLGGSGRGSL